MKTLSKKSVLLFCAAMASCAFAVPSMASAASWGAINTEHTLDGPGLGFNSVIPLLGAVSSSCNQTQFTIDVRSVAILTITSAAFINCTMSGPNIGDCTVTARATNLPWTATGVTTTNVQIHDIVIDLRFETLPGSAPGSCINLHGIDATVTGTLSNIHWTGNGANQHELILNNAPGLTLHGPTGTSPVTLLGTIRDTQQTLTLS